MQDLRRHGRRAASCLLPCLIVLGLSAGATAAAGDPLPSWSEGPARQALVTFVERVTKEGGPDFVPPAERVAVFDNDGALWSEQPMYVQLAFALDRVKALAPEHPEWKEKEPFASVLRGDLAGVAASGEHGLLELVMASHAGNTTEEFAGIVEDWLAKARHPRLGRPYTEAVYQPMLELLAYLRANGFKTFIVSGGGIEFLRPWAERVYGVPPEQVVGSSVQTRYELRDGKPAIVRLPAIDFIDDKAGKPVGIHKFIGRRPILAFGNSDGDFEMLEWTTAGPGPRLGLLVHHDDAEREVAYDRQSSVGRLDRGLDEAPKRGWTLVSMKRDWKRVFPSD
jgi:phosphoglycolate phosphatase-like HAD superfamily hydrolase